MNTPKYPNIAVHLVAYDEFGFSLLSNAIIHAFMKNDISEEEQTAFRKECHKGTLDQRLQNVKKWITLKDF